MAPPAKKPSRLIYLYGITREPAPDLRLGEGIDGASPVETRGAEGLVCWISSVDAEEFGALLQQNMENLDWLANASVRHQRVVDAIHHRIEILPARFATVFRNQSSLEQHVREQKAALRKSFAAVAGADEYAVKVFAVGAAPVVTSASSGSDYLKRKAEALRKRAPRTITPELEDFMAALHRLARDAAEGGRVGAGQKNLLWQRALLVSRDKRAELEKRLQEFSQQWGGQYRVECTGPWPPYSFLKSAARAGS